MDLHEFLIIFHPQHPGENDGVHIRGSECDQKILSKKESMGFVYSPNYPFPYVPKVVCRYENFNVDLNKSQISIFAHKVLHIWHARCTESRASEIRIFNI